MSKSEAQLRYAGFDFWADLTSTFVKGEDFDYLDIRLVSCATCLQLAHFGIFILFLSGLQG